MSKLTIFTDGGSRGNPGLAAIGVFVSNEQQQAVFQQASFIGRATNNEAEYKALLASLEWLSGYLKSNVVASVEWVLDSKLVVQQLNRNWKIKEPRLRSLAEQAWQLLDSLECEYALTHVGRERNRRADELVNKALDALQ